MPNINILVDGIVYGFQRYGGINTYFNEILERMSRYEGSRVRVLLPNLTVGPPPRSPVIRLKRDPLSFRTNLSWRANEFLKRMNKRGNELIRKWRAACHPNTVFHSTYFTFLESKVPQVASVYDMNHERFPERYDSEWGRQLRSQYRAYVARATRVIAISDQTRGDITRYYGVPAEQIDVIPLAVCRDTFKYDQTLKQSGVLASVYNIDRPYLLFVGMRNTAYKNFREFLATFAHSGMGESLLLVVAGADWNDEERLLLGRLNVKDSVRLVVHPDNTVLRNLYSSSLAFVYPSLFEGFGIPLLEAMACETLVLASDTPIFREVGGDAPVYFEPLDPGSMIRAMSQALDPLVRETHIRRGRDRVSQYSWERCARDTYRVYQRVLGR